MGTKSIHNRRVHFSRRDIIDEMNASELESEFDYDSPLVRRFIINNGYGEK